MGPERSDGLTLLNEACKAVEDRIKQVGGNFQITMAPKVVPPLTRTSWPPGSRELRRRTPRWKVMMMMVTRSAWAATKTSTATMGRTRREVRGMTTRAMENRDK